MRSTKPFDTNMAIVIAAVGFVSLAIGQQTSEPSAPAAKPTMTAPVAHAGMPVKVVDEVSATGQARDHLRKDRDAALARSTDREPAVLEN